MILGLRTSDPRQAIVGQDVPGDVWGLLVRRGVVQLLAVVADDGLDDGVEAERSPPSDIS